MGHSSSVHLGEKRMLAPVRWRQKRTRSGADLSYESLFSLHEPYEASDV